MLRHFPLVSVRIHVDRLPEIAHLGGALDDLRLFARAVQCRQQDSPEQRDDADDDEQFDQRKRWASAFSRYGQFDEGKSAGGCAPHAASAKTKCSKTLPARQDNDAVYI